MKRAAFELGEGLFEFDHEEIPTPSIASIEITISVARHIDIATAVGGDTVRQSIKKSPDIAPLDALIYRAKSKDVHCVMVDGTIVYQDGEFMGVSREEILDTISQELSKPLSDEEQSRRDLREQVFESVEAFYENYLDGEIKRAPFYPSSSRL